MAEYNEQRFEELAIGRPAMNQHNISSFSYDAKHPPTSTQFDGENFQPVLANVPPAVEQRRPKQTDTNEIIGAQTHESRYSTTSGTRKIPSREPTGTYGIEPVTGQPDPLVTQHAFMARQEPPLTQRLSHGDGSENLQSTLTAYEAGAATGGDSAGAYELYRSQQPSQSAPLGQEAIPRSGQTMNYFGPGSQPAGSSNTMNPTSATDAPFVPSAMAETGTSQKPTKSYGELQQSSDDDVLIPSAHRTNSSFTISDLHIPGEYPKQ